MEIKEFIDRIEKLNDLIGNEKTGTPKQFADRLGISRSNLYHLLDELYNMDVSIKYSRKKSTFYYTRPVKITALFNIQFIDDDNDLININGGSFIFPVPYFLLDGRNISLYPYPAGTKS